jgi:hypothetical protein
MTDPDRSDLPGQPTLPAGSGGPGHAGQQRPLRRPSFDPPPELAPALRERLQALMDAGWDHFVRFDAEVRRKRFHPFVPADYDQVLAALLPLREPGLKFLEWGSGTGVITMIADLLGFEACGIELDEELVAFATELARETGSGARFAAGSFLPAGYRWRPAHGDGRTGTIGDGPSGYPELGLPLEAFDVVYGYPWGGEEALMLDLMKKYGNRRARLLIHEGNRIRVYRDGKPIA